MLLDALFGCLRRKLLNGFFLGGAPAEGFLTELLKITPGGKCLTMLPVATAHWNDIDKSKPPYLAATIQTYGSAWNVAPLSGVIGVQN